MKLSHFKTLSILACSSLLLFACQSEPKTETDPPGIETEYMDTSVRPQDDFFTYVNGKWVETTEIPDDRVRWGGFGILRKQTDADVLKILKEAEESGQYDADSDQGKAIQVFNSIMDTNARNTTGIEPLKTSFEKINTIKDIESLQTVLAKNPVELSSPFMGLFVYSDPNDSNTNVAYLGTGGLGLPERDYYLKDDEDSKEIREDYKVFVSDLFEMTGENPNTAKSYAETILEYETILAKPRLSKVERRDFRNYNNRYAVEDIKTLTPSVDWSKFMTDLGIEKQPDTVLVMQTKYMKTLDSVFKNSPIDDLKTLVKWSTLNSSASRLSMDLDKRNWEFYSKRLRGAKAQRPLDERALAVVNGSIGEAVGKLYVDEKFPPEAKKKAEEMVANVIEAFKTRVNNLDWMSDSTKVKAIEKLDKFTVKIGYPDEFKDYSDLDVKPENSYYENRLAVSAWNFRDDLSKIGEPVDKTEWGMSPQTVNAYFNPFYNEIVFPAAILQPPFYNYKADMAVNYGGIGAVIGHEISHAFDDSGARYDADGNLKNWWTDQDLENFTERGDKLAELYSSIEVLDSVYIDGKFTLGENIGDLGGVLAAYDGLQMYLEENGSPGKIEGFTPEQRFFLSWATVWRTKMRDEALKTQVKTDPHSPGMYRAYVPLQNVDAFYEAFNVKEGDSLYIAPENRVRIW
ncbi:M13 family metallopeptidase [Mesohalobacter halotolerans]|uniref:M13 family metallopeptidase n=1 Tax=Mesohalobacter halotolerans TaxID=1883405 RepID=A0A4U5TUM4_9FLAO|nr:M13 family metallopeptidase [Mesohalobacter halotolerans]MBS3737798.1 M13 family metallopeptidase [Psychroflexus sp.]TKS57224.1 M13 family metallopeptidase [Mesohalobacter halotolerans]